MGSGKTTLGRKLAGMLSYEFIDMDYSIEQEHGLSIPSIFERYGEEVFREWEAEALTRLAFEDKNVVATGGGVPCFYNNMELMNQTGITVYLKLSADQLYARLAEMQENRPLIRGMNEKELRNFTGTA